MIWRRFMVRHAHHVRSTFPSRRVQPAHQATGFSYTEVLVAITLISILLIPALESLHSGVLGSGIHSAHANHHHRLTGKMEEILAKSFSSLEQEADAAGGPAVVVDAYSDTAGTASRRLVYLARYDGDNIDADNNPFTDVDAGLLWVNVQIEGENQALESLISQ
ncbi:MAG: hypothetical protein JMN24_17220 [gamma proteobacterium endosymbiont of Lamellibrachia anaximandri]|nr:hypothetical protein [gamma proteobacterium endosymbiont of Lamellibrachia anaximandri]MBL3619074.1 hypothetical protein [gamma proteobacterium endosymbiont of Lamellibrachia anaximandri]